MPNVLTNGADRWNGTDAIDYVEARDGDDILHAAGGDDSLNGGAGNDQLYGEAGNDVLHGQDGDDLVDGGSGNNRLYGELGNDHLIAGAGNDLLDGGDGDDILESGDGADQVSGGGGNDWINAVSNDASVRKFSGGAGMDVFHLGLASTTLQGKGVISDFQAGANGDRMEFDAGFFGTTANPFSDGHLRLLQNGADTLVQRDPDGPSGPLGWQTVITLANVQASTITADNFAAHWDPHGGPTSPPPPPPATTQLTQQDDDWTGTSASENVDGLGGDDVLRANGGDDILHGGAGNDTLDAGMGNSKLYGDAGNDGLYGSAGSNLLDGGDGNDYLDGGSAGDDVLVGGGGDDMLIAHSATATMSGGSGRDLFIMPLAASSARVITDFQAGAGGDILRFEQDGYEHNPFLHGDLRLRQSGADTLLQIGDGSGTESSFHTMLVLRNVTATSLTVDNFDDHWSPTGAQTPVNGTDAAESIGPYPDGGTVHAAGGDDVIVNGPGVDTIYAEDGNDIVVLNFDAVGDMVFGGNGNDDFLLGHGGATVNGGAGSDKFEDVSAAYAGIANTLTGGTGSDLYILGDHVRASVDRITDFAAGAGGDLIDLSRLWPSLQGLQSNVNPFAAGYLRLRADGADTVLELDTDGPSKAGAWQSLLRLEKLAPTQLTKDNFVQPMADPNAHGGTHAPVANPDTVHVTAAPHDLLIPFSALLGNDVDADGDPIHITSVGKSWSGIDLQLTADGLLLQRNSSVLRPDDHWDISFTYQIADTSGAFSSTTATIIVDGVDDAPQPQEDAPTLHGTSGAATSFELWRYATDPDYQDTIRITGATAAHGRVGIPSFGSPVFLATGTGHDTLILSVTDSYGMTSQIAVDVEIAGTPGTNFAGTASADSYTGTAGDDVINGAGGNDTLTATAGYDLVHGGDGNDTLYGGAGISDLYGDAGDDRIVIAHKLASSVIDGGEGNDTLVIYGGASGGASIDLADETISSDYAGYAKIHSIENVTIASYTVASYLAGTDGANTLTGNQSSDRLLGRGGADRLDASGGDDYLDGGAGADKLTGGSGADQFVFHKGEAAGDTVTDFVSGTDKIVLIGYGSGTSWSFAGGVLTINDGTLHETIALTGVSAIATSDVLFG